jgi:hypothetical protein
MTAAPLSQRAAAPAAALDAHTSTAAPSPCPCRSFKGLFWKFARVGERLSPWVSIACLCMAVSVVFF